MAPLVRYRLARALETLDEARLLFENGKLHGCVNRLYYACFYAVEALLHSEGRTASKHSGVQSLFNRWWVKPGRIPRDFGEFYNKMFSIRSASDYGIDPQLERAQVEQWVQEAERFVTTVSSQIHGWLRANEPKSNA
ncbi:HEPN domain-containing protein [Geochorda subterranea]|uniref:HEPN domain-containing protein n=1 Tax=Geochorda subterranea TaxID=3109564 RepID=A0ABZ1BTS2_9FIRM|nr:HEPN domain-containing protein [Limnochorda sp. LNt]WRP15963.1 HEPN domain-containing protein [Limnochorda sp. LNt]